MRLCEIADQKGIVDGAFRDVELSTTQRRRLALIVALLEQRPICVLDEWAVDQDPLFRRKFYKELIPLFRARGLTVVAVAHDDH
jgi:ABC-type siderophore export system fused ATPase/permease subunit